MLSRTSETKASPKTVNDIHNLPLSAAQMFERWLLHDLTKTITMNSICVVVESYLLII